MGYWAGLVLLGKTASNHMGITVTTVKFTQADDIVLSLGNILEAGKETLTSRKQPRGQRERDVIFELLKRTL